MSNHRITIVGDRLQCMARCSCKKQSPMTNRANVEEWIFTHHQDIERIRARLGGRSPSLTNQRDWFRQQAEDPSNPAEDRRLWKQLADEVDAFVSTRTGPPKGQLALF